MNLGVTCPGWSSVASCTRWCDGWQVVLKKQEMNIAERCQQYRTRLDFSVKASSMKSTLPCVRNGLTACLTPSAIPPDAQTVTAIAPTRFLTSSSIKLDTCGRPLYILTVSLLLSTRPLGLEMKSLMRRHCLRPFMRRTSSIQGRTHSRQSDVGTVQMRTILCVAVVPLL
jgi:hypothetical protein